jgi:hypothetical protein
MDRHESNRLGQYADGKSVQVKGRSPQHRYIYSLPDVFGSFRNTLTIDECISLLRSEGVTLDKKDLLRTLFSYRRPTYNQGSERLPFSFAGPFQMKSVVNSLFQFNLRYQDAVVKIELEKAEEITRTPQMDAERNGTLKRVLRIVSAVLRTAFFSEEPLYLELTNMELDNIVLKCLSLLTEQNRDIQGSETSVDTGYTANEISQLVQNQVLSDRTAKLEDILPFTLYSGVVWWSDTEVQLRFKESPHDTLLQLGRELTELTKNDLAINDFHLFRSEVVEDKTHKRVLYFLDDNGELVWDLLLIRLLLEVNPHLSITCIANESPITNNVNVTVLLHYLREQSDHLSLLEDERFEYIGEPNELPAIDLRFISPRLKKQIEEADVILVKGVSFFEKLQYLPAPTYYLFTVYSETSKLLTGLERHRGVFARIGPHLCCFSHIIETSNANPVLKMSLATLHSALQTPAYKEFIEQFASESEANLFLRSKSSQEGTTLEMSIRQLEFCQ